MTIVLLLVGSGHPQLCFGGSLERRIAEWERLGKRRKEVRCARRTGTFGPGLDVGRPSAIRAA